MHPHPLLGLSTLLAEGRSLDGLIYGLLTIFAAMNLPALLGLLALWKGRPRDLWAVVAFLLGGCSIVPAVYLVHYGFQEGGDWPLSAARGLPLGLGLWVCGWACRCWWPSKEPAAPQT